MYLKSTLLALAVGLFGVNSAFAQSEVTEAATKVAKEYAVSLSFTDEQVQQAKKIFTDHLVVSRENWQISDGERDAFNTRQQETFKATDGKIKAMLNDEQLEVYKANRDDLKRKALDKYLSEVLEKE